MRYLVVCDQTLGSDVVDEHIEGRRDAESSTFHMLAPASHPGGTWTWSEGADHAIAERQLRQGLDRLAAKGFEVTGEVGDPNAVQAVTDVLLHRPGQFDEILLVTWSGGLSRRFGGDLSHRVERLSALPVSHIAVSLTRSYAGQEIPQAGNYVIDRPNSSVEFVARFLMISKVRGRFGDFSGELHIAENAEDSSVVITIEAASLSTGDPRRDSHLRSADFLDVERFPTLSFSSTTVEPRADQTWRVSGDLGLHGVTRPVELDVEFTGAVATDLGEQRAGFAASTEIDREDWGLTWNQTLEAGGVLVGKKIHIELDVQAVRGTI